MLQLYENEIDTNQKNRTTLETGPKNMKTFKNIVITTMAVMSLVTVGAKANIVTGSIWENFDAATPMGTGNTDGSLANVTTMQGIRSADVTFSAPSTPLSFSSYGAGNIPGVNPGGDFSNGSADYTIASFLGTGGASGIAYHNGATGSMTVDDALFYFTGTVSLTNGQSFIVEHDDGVQLNINGVDVVDNVGPTVATNTGYTWGGSTGTFTFKLSYAEVQGDPAVLYTNLPLVSVPTTPDGGMTVALLGIGVTGLAFFCRKFWF